MNSKRQPIAWSGWFDTRVESINATKEQFVLPEEQLIIASINDLLEVNLTEIKWSKIHQSDGVRYYDINSVWAKQQHFEILDSIRVERIYYPWAAELEPALLIEQRARRENDRDFETYRYIYSSRDGHLLDRQNLTVSDSYSYRVWAEPTTLRPLDGPTAEYTPHPTSQPDGFFPASVAPSLVSVDGLNHNASGGADPWLPPSAVNTTGNNVDAYTDYGADGFDASQGDIRATVTSPGVFDRVFDVNSAPLANAEQKMASVTQLFYTNNWLHDWWYDSGFDELSGNAQSSNFGRGGQENDSLRAEAQDGADTGKLNNANMSAGTDGTRPRMQMFLWSTYDNHSLTVSPPNESITHGLAVFGPQSFDVLGDIVLVNDGVIPTSDACEPIVDDLSGKIALIDRGTCQFESKVVNAQNQGAVGVIIVNNNANGAPTMGAGTNGGAIIPSMSTTLAQGDAIKANLLLGNVTAHLARDVGPKIDGTIDNSIVAHEWGHLLHHRLVQCSNAQCQAQSEGWGDFLALHMAIREGDNFDGTYAIAAYATQGKPNSAYFGLRRYPYSYGFEFNPLTFAMIGDNVSLPSSGAPKNPSSGASTNSEIHNAGELWAVTLNDCYLQLLRDSQGPNPRYSFEEARRRMSDYIVIGMKMSPSEPSFTEQRDALLAAALANDPIDMHIIAEAFARRGLGTAAVSPPKSSTSFAETVEHFELLPVIGPVTLSLSDGDESCDQDGILDNYEVGQLHVEFQNVGPVVLQGASISVQSSDPSITFPLGANVALNDIAPFATIHIDIPVEKNNDSDSVSDVTLSATLSAPLALSSPQLVALTTEVQADIAPSSASQDPVVFAYTDWTELIRAGQSQWARMNSNSGAATFWHANEPAWVSDVSLVSPELLAGNGPITLTFDHRHHFESSVSGNTNLYWDGGVIEISLDHGSTWNDISLLAQPGYNGNLSSSSGNPLSGRQAFVGANPQYPMFETVSVNLGLALVNQSFQLAFRSASDSNNGDEGWSIDNIAISGLTNTPFSSLIENQMYCDSPPTANAGDDVIANEGTVIVLDGSGSFDPDNQPINYAWVQLSGPAVELTVQGATASFSTWVDADTGFSFELIVNDSTHFVTDLVNVTVIDLGPNGTGGIGGSMGGFAGTSGQGLGGNNGGSSVGATGGASQAGSAGVGALAGVGGTGGIAGLAGASGNGGISGQGGSNNAGSAGNAGAEAIGGNSALGGTGVGGDENLGGAQVTGGAGNNATGGAAAAITAGASGFSGQTIGGSSGRVDAENTLGSDTANCDCTVSTNNNRAAFWLTVIYGVATYWRRKKR